VIEEELASPITEDSVLLMTQEYTYGSFEINSIGKRRLGREAFLSIHMSPQVLDLGCILWDWLIMQSEADDGVMLVGVHLRVEVDFDVWWSAFGVTKLLDILQLYEDKINASRRPGIRTFGYLALGDLDNYRHSTVTHWANNLFGSANWVSKKHGLHKLRSTQYSSLPVDVIALIDAYVLVKCAHFVGHPGSSYSFTIQQWRKSLDQSSSYVGYTPIGIQAFQPPWPLL